MKVLNDSRDLEKAKCISCPQFHFTADSAGKYQVILKPARNYFLHQKTEQTEFTFLEDLPLLLTSLLSRIPQAKPSSAQCSLHPYHTETARHVNQEVTSQSCSPPVCRHCQPAAAMFPHWWLACISTFPPISRVSNSFQCLSSYHILNCLMY